MDTCYSKLILVNLSYPINTYLTVQVVQWHIAVIRGVLWPIPRPSTYGLLICTLISENRGLEKSRSVSNLRKISGPTNLDFFQIYGINLAIILGGVLEKIQVRRT